MKNKVLQLTVSLAFLVFAINACAPGEPKQKELSPMEQLTSKFVQVPLTADISHLSANEKEMLKLLFKAADIMDELFWLQNYGDKNELLDKIDDPAARKFAMINYGPWDQLDNQRPFIESYGPKPRGAMFYPADMTDEEFEALDNPDKSSEYTLIRRGDDGQLKVLWYHEAYQEKIHEAAFLLRHASELAGDPEFAQYLNLRALALLTDDYLESDMAWMDVRNNNVDIVIGPIEHYLDSRYGIKAAHEAFILIKDHEWSNRLSRYSTFLPELQRQLPVDPAYKQEEPGIDDDINAYDAIYYAGDCNMASKSIAINLPNDERVHLAKGSRKLQLKNSMKAKFDHILMPIAEVLIAPEQRQYITFDAFFSNVMFHEVAHGMGVKMTIDGKSTIRQALLEQYSPIEEVKADILGLFLLTQLSDMGEWTETELMENYVTFMAGFFRSVRFGAASAHGKANMLAFNYFLDQGAFNRNDDGTYAIDLEKMQLAARDLSRKVITLQGDGDYKAAKAWVEGEGVIKSQLQEDLKRVSEAGIPVDIYFEMGPQMVGLE